MSIGAPFGDRRCLTRELLDLAIGTSRTGSLWVVANALDLVRSTIGEPAGPDLVLGVEALPLARLDTLAEELVALPQDPGTLAAKPVTELWPVIPWEASVFFEYLNGSAPTGMADAGLMSGGVNLTAAVDPRLRGSGVFSDGLVRSLLYSHGVAISDPIRHAASTHLSAPSEIRAFSRDSVATAVAAMSEVSDLVDAGIVLTFYLGDTVFGPALELNTAMHQIVAAPDSLYPRNAVRRETQEDLFGAQDHTGALANAFMESLQETDFASQAIAATAFTLAAVELSGGGLDVLSASKVMGRLLFLGAPDPVEELRLSEVANTTVPNLGALSLRDLVEIRASSDALALWREDLARALDFSQRLRERGEDPVRIQQGVEEIVADGRAALHREAARTRMLTPQGLLGFVAGALAGASGGVLAGDTKSAVGGAGAGIFASFLTALGTRRQVPGFLDRHYVAFRPDAQRP